jgi:hypothetical protein
MAACGEGVGNVLLSELTLGHAVVLESIGCPLLQDEVELAKLRVMDLLPTIYVLGVPVAESMQAFNRGGKAAVLAAAAEWGAKIPLADGKPLCEAVGRIFRRVSVVAPQGGPEGNVPAATAG